jgi:chromosome partitioning protein
MDRSQTICVINRKGGSGKSTTTRNLAGVLQRAGMCVLIGDLDPQASLTRLLVDQLDRPGLGACLLDTSYAAMDCLIETPSGLDLLPGDTSIEQAALTLASLGSGHLRLRRVLAGVTGYDVLLLDTPPALGFALSSAAIAAGWAILPTFTTQEDLDALSDTLDVLDQLRADGIDCAEVLAVVPNRLYRDSADQAGLSVLQQTFGVLVSRPIPHLVAIKQASNARLPLDRYDPKSPALVAYQDLAERVRQATVRRDEPREVTGASR